MTVTFTDDFPTEILMAYGVNPLNSIVDLLPFIKTDKTFLVFALNTVEGTDHGADVSLLPFAPDTLFVGQNLSVGTGIGSYTNIIIDITDADGTFQTPPLAMEVQFNADAITAFPSLTSYQIGKNSYVFSSILIAVNPDGLALDNLTMCCTDVAGSFHHMSVAEIKALPLAKTFAGTTLGLKTVLHTVNPVDTEMLEYVCVYELSGQDPIIAVFPLGRYSSPRDYFPRFAETERANLDNELGPETVCVVYNTDFPEAKEVADYYAAARGIPAGNLIGIQTTDSFPLQQNSITQSQIVAFLADFRDVFNPLDDIYHILLIGDFPHLTSSESLDSVLGLRQTHTYDGSVHPAESWWIKTLRSRSPDAFNWYRQNVFGEFTSGAFTDSEPLPLGMSQETDEFVVPKNRTPKGRVLKSDVLSVFRIPVGNYAEEVQVAKDRIDTMITVEQTHSAEWGQSITYGATDKVACVPLLEDMIEASEDWTLSGVPDNTFWHLLWTETQWEANDDNELMHPICRISLDVQGDVDDFPTTRDTTGLACELMLTRDFANDQGDVWCMASGRRSYYSTHGSITAGNYTSVLLEGDIDLEPGAMGVWSQSYGAIPSPAISENMHQVNTLNLQAETDFDIKGEATDLRFHVRGLNRHGTTLDVYRLSTATDTGNVPSLEVTATEIILRRPTYGTDTYVHTGKTYTEILSDLVAHWWNNFGVKIHFQESSTPMRWSRAYAGWRAGFCYSSGVTKEPRVNGQTTTEKLYSSIRLGLSFGERALLIQSQDGVERWVGEAPNFMLQYGDPLYRPYGRYRNMTTKIYAVDIEFDNAFTAGYDGGDVLGNISSNNDYKGGTISGVKTFFNINALFITGMAIPTTRADFRQVQVNGSEIFDLVTMNQADLVFNQNGGNGDVTIQFNNTPDWFDANSDRDGENVRMMLSDIPADTSQTVNDSSAIDSSLDSGVSS